MRSKFVIFFAFLLIVNCSETKQVDTSFYPALLQDTKLPLLPDKKIKNVILLIGDGMSFAQISAARIHSKGADGLLHLERMPVSGMIKTHSTNNLITDSGAASTALATGVKTVNLRISMDPENKKLLTILEVAQQIEMATGLVATSEITHATPAAFGSHVKWRSNQSSIAVQLLEHKINVLLGGGKVYFLPESKPGGQRKDNRNLIEEAQSQGYQFVDSREKLLSSNGSYLLGLFAGEGLTTRDPEPSLREMTEKALSILENAPKGFFLMVEGSQVDWAAHDNDQEETLRQMLLFDEAVKEVLDFAVKDGQTLVIVTGDHETGGLAINGGQLDGSKIQLEWTTENHTGIVTPVFAFGPKAEYFSGVMDNTDIPILISNFLGVQNFPRFIE